MSGDRHAQHPADSIGEVGVPTVHRFGPYRFFFYSQENRASYEAPHIHVASGRRSSRVLAPAGQPAEQPWGTIRSEVERVRRIVVANRELLLRSLE